MIRKSGIAPNVWAVPLVLSRLILYEDAHLSASLFDVNNANIHLIDLLKILISDDLLRVAADQLSALVQDRGLAAQDNGICWTRAFSSSLSMTGLFSGIPKNSKTYG